MTEFKNYKLGFLPVVYKTINEHTIKQIEDYVFEVLEPEEPENVYFLTDDEMLLPCLDQSGSLHPSQFLRQRSPFHIQIIGHLLPVERDIEFPALGLQRNRVQVGHDAAADGFRRRMKAAAGQMQILQGGNRQNVFRKSGRPRRCRCRQLMRVAHTEKQYPAVLIGDHVHQQRLVVKQRVGLGKKLPDPDMAEDRPIAPGVVALNGHAALQNKAELLCDIPGMQKSLALLIVFFLRVKGRQRGKNLLFRHSLEKPRFSEKTRIHGKAPPFFWNVVITTYFQAEV